MTAQIKELNAIFNHIKKCGEKAYGDSTVESYVWKGIKVQRTSTRSDNSDDAVMETSYIIDTKDVYAWCMDNRFHLTRGTEEQIKKIHSFLDLIK